jgi:serine/threonine-protein kinase
MRENALFAVRFDAAALRVTGTAVPVLEDVAATMTDGTTGYAVSENGTLTYLRSSAWKTPRRVFWADRTGTEQLLLPEPGQWAEPRLSPDGRSVALTKLEPHWQLWLYDVPRRILSQLTHSEGVSFGANWMPDGKSLIHSVETPVYDLHRVPIDGSAPETLVVSKSDKMASSISPDGRTLAYHENHGTERVMLAPIAGGAAVPLDPRPSSQHNAAFSPDGRWVAYEEFGADSRPDVYVRALDGRGGRHQVSNSGGDQPLWTRGGREIVYRRGDQVIAASFDPARGEAGVPAVLFRKRDAGRLGDLRTRGYDVTPDGSRFLMVAPVDDPEALPTVVVINWLDELKRKVP